MAYTFDELVHKRRAADLAQNRVEELRDAYGPPTQQQWTPRQSSTYETAVRAWRDLDRDWRTALAEYVRRHGQTPREVEAEVGKALRPEGDGPDGGDRDGGGPEGGGPEGGEEAAPAG